MQINILTFWYQIIELYNDTLTKAMLLSSQSYGCYKNHFCIATINEDANFDKLVHENMFTSFMVFTKTGLILCARNKFVKHVAHSVQT